MCTEEEDAELHAPQKRSSKWNEIGTKKSALVGLSERERMNKKSVANYENYG